MESNMDFALWAKRKADKAISLHDFTGAKEFLSLTKFLVPDLDGTEQMAAVVDVHLAEQLRISGNEMDMYAIMQVDSSADDNTINEQYRKLALILDPDRNKVVGADVAFKLIGKAFEILSDKGKRALHDMKKITFWTVCPSCKIAHHFPRKYENSELHCPSCRLGFVARDTGVDGQCTHNWAQSHGNVGARIGSSWGSSQIGMANGGPLNNVLVNEGVSQTANNTNGQMQTHGTTGYATASRAEFSHKMDKNVPADKSSKDVGKGKNREEMREEKVSQNKERRTEEKQRQNEKPKSSIMSRQDAKRPRGKVDDTSSEASEDQLSVPVPGPDYHDKSKRTLHDSKRTSVKLQVMTKTSQSVNGTSSVSVPWEPVDAATFWTACPTCKIQYKYPRLYENCQLRCPTCKVGFVARDTRVDGKSTHSWTQSYAHVGANIGAQWRCTQNGGLFQGCKDKGQLEKERQKEEMRREKGAEKEAQEEEKRKEAEEKQRQDENPKVSKNVQEEEEEEDENGIEEHEGLAFKAPPRRSIRVRRSYEVDGSDGDLDEFPAN